MFRFPRIQVLTLAAFALSACVGEGDLTHHTNPPPPGSSKAITSFALRASDNPALSADVAGTFSGTSIALTVPNGTVVTHLAPTLVETGASVSPASGAVQDFTHPVAYTVTAADGSTQTYTATVSVAASNAKDITQFSLAGVNGTITGTNISVMLPNGTNLTSLVPTIVETGVGVIPASGEAHDFSSPATYLVSAADGSTKSYTVTVSVALSSSKDITGFSINGVSGAIAGTSISLTVPNGTSVTSLTPTIVQTGASVSPASGASADFTNPVNYTVTAADGSTQIYSVTVSVQAGVNLSTAIITDGSAGDVANWSQTATITAVNITSGAVEVDFDKKDGPNRWPDECDLPGFTPDCLQYSVWIFEYVGGQWYGTGAIQMWYGRADTGAAPAGWTVEQQIQQNWIYYSGVMANHTLVAGEQVGFMVTTGDERMKNNADLQERSNVLLVTLQ